MDELIYLALSEETQLESGEPIACFCDVCGETKQLSDLQETPDGELICYDCYLIEGGEENDL